MANYFEMNRDELVAEQEKLKEQYKKFQDMQLKLNKIGRASCRERV